MKIVLLFIILFLAGTWMSCAIDTARKEAKKRAVMKRLKDARRIRDNSEYYFGGNENE